MSGPRLIRFGWGVALGLTESVGEAVAEGGVVAVALGVDVGGVESSPQAGRRAMRAMASGRTQRMIQI
jgi:hypothetical protein